MTGLGTIVNAGAVIAGGVAGTLLRSGIPEKYKKIVMQGIGLSVLFIGISGTIKEMITIVNGNKLDRQFVMLMIFSLVIGGLLGEFLKIEKRLENVGIWFQSKIPSKGGSFSDGFVTASLVYCVGAMAIVGSLEDGLSGNPSTLFAKSILDGVSAVIFAATLGIGVAFSALPVFIYQGGITLLAGLLQPWLTETVISQMSLVGGILIFAIGINLLEIKKINVGNLLPSIFIPVLYYLISTAFH
ncbi:MAG: putative rane protein possible Na+ channel or pump [Eubacterium sp.]|nr:putative rane protein possible Na+ channel or pump [Eubacterium sp.]